MQRIAVTKCQGTGNDFVLYDARGAQPLPYPQLARRLCDRRRGIGADGLLVLDAARAADADVSMQIYNQDGSQAEMCGNGIRCVARYVWEHEPQRERLRVATVGGVIRTQVRSGGPGDDVAVRVDMGEPQFQPLAGGAATLSVLAGKDAAFDLVSMGNPHLVILTDRDPEAIDLAAIARQAESLHSGDLTPNIELAWVRDVHAISMRVFERGAGETWACGTGACAVVAAALRLRRVSDPVTVRSRGGEVLVEWAGPGSSCWLTGDAGIVFEAQVVVPDAARFPAAAV
ncbi:MAG: diaminopimelate epimerase [Candidatus Eremiobacteraeota bacterium]|nr:diaminopimelate epimerase [Candidatus Eremiobacteraeota bacterium]